MDDSPEKQKKIEAKLAGIMNRCAVFVGIGIGLLILVPCLPSWAEDHKMLAMKDLFGLTGFCIVGYGILLLFSVYFIRKNALLIDGIMNWFVIPSYGIWFLMQAYDILMA